MTAPVYVPSYIWHNGLIESYDLKGVQKSFQPETDMVFSLTLLTSGTDILFFSETFKRFLSLIRLYQFSSRLLNDESGEALRNEVKRVLVRNKYYLTGRCHLHFHFIAETGLTDERILIEPDPLLFSARKVVPDLIFSRNFSKPDGFAMKLPTLEQEYRKLLKKEMDQGNVIDCVVLNQHREVVETFLGNLFLVFENEIVTPGLASGCSPEIVRKGVIERLFSLNYRVVEKDQVTRQDLLNCNELFTAGKQGIFFVRGIENKRYFDRVRKVLLQSLTGQLPLD